MPEDPKAKSVLHEFERMALERSTYEPAWTDIRQLVFPNTSDFNQAQVSPGDVRTGASYDGTAMQANVDLANAVHSFVINPSERNYGIKVTADRELNEDPEVIAWCDLVSDIIAAEYSDDRTRFHASVQECFLGLAYGNVILNQEMDYDNGHLSFRSCPLSWTYFDENSRGNVDKVCRKLEMSVRQIEQAFPNATWERKADDKPEKKYTVIHSVYPRKDRMPGRRDTLNMPFASCWCLKEKCVLLEEGGYTSFPYHVGRWSKSNDEVYGRGPAINCLPEIRMLNRMEFTIIKAWQKAVDPPLIMPNDGFIGKFRTAPGSINFKDSSMGEFEVQTLEHKGKLEGAETKSDQKRERIKTSFYSEWVKFSQKKERQTAFEISELIEQQLRMMAPVLGPIQTDFMVPCIQRSYMLKAAAGHFPPAPPQMDGATIEVDYVSASARAQAATRLFNYNRYIQSLAILQPFAPNVMDAVDPDFIAQDMAILSGVPRRGIRSPDAIIEIRAARARQDQMAAMVEAGPKIGKTVLDLSKANEAGGLL